MPGIDYYTTKPTGAGTAIGDESYFVDPDYIKHAKLDEMAVRLVLSVKQQSEAAYNHKKTRMLDQLHHYLNLPRPRKYADQSNIPLPMASEAVDTHHHAIMNRMAALKQRPCQVQPSPINPTEDNKQAARLIDAKLYIDNQMMNWEDKFDGVCKSALIFGAGLACTRFVETIESTIPEGLEGIEGVQLETEHVVHQGYTFDQIDPIDFYPCKNKMSINDRHPDVTRYFMSYEELLEADESGAGFFDLDKIEEKRRAVPNYAYDERSQRRNLLGLVDDSRSISDAIEVLQSHAWLPIDKSDKQHGEYVWRPVIITTANGTLIGLKKNPDPDNMMSMAEIDKVPGTFWPQSIIEKIHPQIHAGNTVLDLVLENIASTVHKMRVVIMDALIDPSELYSRPDGFIRLKPQYGRVQDVLQEMTTSPLGPEVFRLLDFFMTGGERTSGASATFKGTSTPGVETAEESRNLAGFSSMHNEYFLNRLESSFVRHSHQKGQYINVTYCSFPMWFAVGGPMASQMVKIGSGRELAYKVIFVGLASTLQRERTIALQQASQLLEIVKGHPALEPLMGRVLAKIVELFNWPDLEDFKKLIDIGWEQYTMNKRMELGAMQEQQSVRPAQGIGMKVPGASGGVGAPGQIQSNPQRMTRATTGSDVAKNLMSFANTPQPGNIGRR